MSNMWRKTNWLRILWCQVFHRKYLWNIEYRFGTETCCSKCTLSRYQDCVWA